MRCNSAYLWEKSRSDLEMPVSLLLQQALVCGKNVLLACVCEGRNGGRLGVTESGYFTEGLVEWFHREFLKKCERKTDEEVLEKALEKEIQRLQKELKHYMNKKMKDTGIHFWCMLLYDDSFFILAKGTCKGYLINRRFREKNFKEIILNEKEDGLCVLKGKVQRKLGILICTDSYLSKLKNEETIEVLNPEEELEEERMKKRLEELWRECVSRGETQSVGAIYVRTL